MMLDKMSKILEIFLKIGARRRAVSEFIGRNV